MYTQTHQSVWVIMCTYYVCVILEPIKIFRRCIYSSSTKEAKFQLIYVFLFIFPVQLAHSVMLVSGVQCM